MSTWIHEDEAVVALVNTALATADKLWNAGLVNMASSLEEAAAAVPVEDES